MVVESLVVQKKWLYPALRKAKLKFVPKAEKSYARKKPIGRYFPDEVRLYSNRNNTKFKIYFENVKFLNEWEVYCGSDTTPSYLFTFCKKLAEWHL